MKVIRYIQIGKNLIATDWIIFKKVFIDKFIDISIWIILTIFVTGYVMPHFGLSADFGLFQLGGVIAAVGLFEVYVSAVDLVADLQADRIIDYSLTLPIPSWFAIISKAAYYFLVYLSLTLAILPLGKILLYTQLDLFVINYFQLFLAILFQSMFYACFVIWAASVIHDISQLGSVWSRFIFPMWFMGGFQFSWFSLYTVTPIIAWIDLLNPMIYITEATRVALLGQTDYLNFWICLGAITFFSALILWIGLLNLKKRLDFVW